MRTDILCGLCSLCRIGETYTEYILRRSHLQSGTGRRNHEKVIRLGFRTYGNCRGTGCRSYQELHSPVFQAVICVNGFLLVMLVIRLLILNLIPVDTAIGINLVNGNLRTVHYGIPVNGSTSRQRSLGSDLPFLSACIRFLSFTSLCCSTSFTAVFFTSATSC